MAYCTIVIASLASQENVRIYEGFHFFFGVEYFEMHITWTDRQYAAKTYHQRKIQIVVLDLNPLSFPLVYLYWHSFHITVAAHTK
ncbi:unnamed protein product [Acanthoscelides obtectus]|uniref:Uncharacterized protein n=1 Tax=Acanthoscelides obtectus TaxID=200917 RepID=A0A9P0Q9F5_ACAOB|nr:unnamed protein product [Acanthoscelides obtectus]CAK1677795.1 hypothetical protein AOBTE_LOCUS31562 [Acanthoscelides obtectus]